MAYSTHLECICHYCGDHVYSFRIKYYSLERGTLGLHHDDDYFSVHDEHKICLKCSSACDVKNNKYTCKCCEMIFDSGDKLKHHHELINKNFYDMCDLCGCELNIYFDEELPLDDNSNGLDLPACKRLQLNVDVHIDINENIHKKCKHLLEEKKEN